MSDSSIHFNKVLDQCIAEITEKGRTIEECLQQYPDAREELEPLLRLTDRLRFARGANASPEFHRIAAARMDLLIQASPRRQPARQDFLGEWKNLFSGFGRGLRFSFSPVIAAILLLVILLSAGTGVVSASSRSLPGDNLYGVKSWVENAQLDLTGSSYGDARLYLDFADHRITEAKELLVRNREEHLGPSIAWYQEQMKAAVSYLDEGSDLTPQQKVVVATNMVKALPAEKSIIDAMLKGASPDVEPQMILAQQLMIAAHEKAAGVLNRYPDMVDLPGGVPDMPTFESFAALDETPEPVDTEVVNGWPTFDETAMWTETVWIMDTPWPTGCPTEWWPTGWPDEWKYCNVTDWPTGIPTNFPTQWPTNWPTEWATYLPTGWQTLVPTIRYLPSLAPTLEYLPSLVPTALHNLPTYIPTLEHLATQFPKVTIPASWPTMPPPPPGKPEPPPGFKCPPGWPCK